MTTLRPFGPSVTLTALARMSTPRSIFSRASPENFTSLADMMVPLKLDRIERSGEQSALLAGGRGAARARVAFDDPHHVALLHDEELLAFELDFGSRPFAEQDAVAGLEVEGNELAAFVTGAGACGDHFAFLRLLLGGVGNDDPAFGLLLRVDALDDDAIMQRAKFHGSSSLLDAHRDLIGPVVQLRLRAEVKPLSN